MKADIKGLEAEFIVMNKIMLKGKIKVIPGILDTVDIEFREPYGKGKIHLMKDRVVIVYQGVKGNEMKKILETCALQSIPADERAKRRVL